MNLLVIAHSSKAAFVRFYPNSIEHPCIPLWSCFLHVDLPYCHLLLVISGLKNWENLNGTTCFGFSWLPCFPLKMISHWFTATGILKAFPFCMASVFVTFRNKSLFFPWFLNVLCIVVCVGGPVVYPFGLSCSFLLLSSCQCLIIELLKSANGGVIGVNWESVLSSAYL